jgi:hypothetical protein
MSDFTIGLGMKISEVHVHHREADLVTGLD